MIGVTSTTTYLSYPTSCISPLYDKEHCNKVSRVASPDNFKTSTYFPSLLLLANLSY